MVPRTLLGTDGFSGSAPAATSGGHQKALTSRSFCNAEIILISCVQIKMKPVEISSIAVLGNRIGGVDYVVALEHLIVFGESLCM